MGYFTRLIKKYLSDKNTVPDVLFVHKLHYKRGVPLDALQQGNSGGTKASKTAGTSIVSNVPEGTNRTRLKTETCYNFVQLDSREKGESGLLGTKEQTVQEFEKKSSHIPHGSFASILETRLTDDERYMFEERAAIKEYDGGLSREQAEKETLEVFLEKRSTRS